MAAKKNGLDSSLVGRKCRAKYNHMWFGAKRDVTWSDPLPTDEGTIVAAYYHREKDGSGGVMVLVESEKGETMDFYAESVILVPKP